MTNRIIIRSVRKAEPDLGLLAIALLALARELAARAARRDDPEASDRTSTEATS